MYYTSRMLTICVLISVVLSSVITAGIMVGMGKTQPPQVIYENIVVAQEPMGPEPYVPKTMRVQGDQLYINGEPADVDIMHHIPSHRTIAPVYQLAEYMDISYYWDDFTLDIRGENAYVFMVVGEHTALVNNHEVDMNAPFILHEQRSVVPLRFIAETMGYTVTWEEMPTVVLQDCTLQEDILARIRSTNPGLPADVSEAIAEHVYHYATIYNVDPIIIAAMMHTESHYRPAINGAAGEIGLMQIMPSTGRRIADAMGIDNYDLWDIETNIHFGVWYLQHNLGLVQNMNYNGPLSDMDLAIIAYNTGIHNLQRHVERGTLPSRYLNNVQNNIDGM